MKINAGLQVHTEVHHFPFNTFTHVFFLFRDKHVVVEELLQFFIGEVDAKLLESVEIENFETSNIKDTLGNSTSSRGTLLNILSLGDHLSSDLNTWSSESLAHISRSNTKQVGDFVSNINSRQLSLLISWFLLVLDVTHHDDTTGNLVRVITFLIRETENFESFSSTFVFKGIVHSVNSDHTLAGPVVILGVVTDHAHLKNVGQFAVHDLEEDMVVSFSRKLEDDTRLFKQVDFNITSSKFTGISEMDTDELTETGRVVVTDSLGITPSFKDGIGLDNLILKTDLTLYFTLSSNSSHVTNDLLGVFSLSSTRFTSNQDRLAFTFSQHVLVCVVSNRVQMGWAFSTLLSTVECNNSFTINLQPFVGVDTDTEETRVCVDSHDSVS